MKVIPVHCTSIEASASIVETGALLPGGPKKRRACVHFALSQPADVGNPVVSGAHYQKQVWWLLNTPWYLHDVPDAQFQISNNNCFQLDREMPIKFLRAVDIATTPRRIQTPEYGA